TRVETTIPVLHQTIRIKNRSASGAQAELSLLAWTGHTQRGPLLHLTEARRAACLKNKGRKVAGIPEHALAGLRIDDQVGQGGDLLVLFGGAEQAVQAA